MRVMLARSDGSVRRPRHSIRGRWGGAGQSARAGLGASTMARLSAYDPVLADIRLPDLCGHDAYRRLREVQPKARVILMTAFGYDPSHSIVNARQEGLRFVLYKPFRVDQVLDALESPAPPPPAAASPQALHA